MSVFITTFEAVVVLLAIGVLGFWLVSRRILQHEVFGLLSPLALDVALPALVFANILFNFNPDESPGWWQLPIWWLGFTVLAAVITAAGALVCRKCNRREFSLSLFYQNALFFPLAIVAGVYGAQSPYLVDLFLFTLFFPVLFFNTWHLFFGQGMQGFNWRRTLNPVLVATILAIGLRLAGWQDYVPSTLASIIQLVGNMAVPVLMIILGGNIYVDLQRLGDIQFAEVGKFVLFKNFLFPLVTLGFLIIVRPPFNIGLIMLLQSAVPPITAVPIVVERAGGNRALVNQFMAASLVVSSVSIPVMVLAFNWFFPVP